MPSTFRAIFYPYAIVVLKDGWFLPVNRNYKPVGVSSREWVDYETHPTRVKIKGLTDRKAESIGLNVSKSAGDADTIYYLYEDVTNPERSAQNWTRYQTILSKLMKLPTAGAPAEP